MKQLGITTLVAGCLLALPAVFPRTASAEDANELARRVLQNEVTAEAQDHSHWMCRLETETSSGKEVDEVVETKFGDLKRRLLVNGQPPTPQQKQDDDERIKTLVSDPQALQSSMKKENDDENQSQKMLKMLPDALIFKFGQRRGNVVELHFTSNPDFHPPSHEAQVFQALEGNMWVDSKQLRLIELTGHLNRDVKFGDGLLGHLDKGGEFHVKQAEVARGYWELTLLNVNMRGKALFFKTINVQQHMRRSGFRKIGDDLTLPQAADLLQKGSVVAQNGVPKAHQR